LLRLDYGYQLVRPVGRGLCWRRPFREIGDIGVEPFERESVSGGDFAQRRSLWGAPSLNPSVVMAGCYAELAAKLRDIASFATLQYAQYLIKYGIGHLFCSIKRFFRANFGVFYKKLKTIKKSVDFLTKILYIYISIGNNAAKLKQI
jgi:hypothetical protein